MIKIAVDGMGGDFAPEPIVKGSIEAVKKFDNIEITIFGDESKINSFLEPHERIKVIHTDKFLEMGVDDPIKAYRRNKDASMFMAMKYVSDGHADAVVTAGPTQAVVVGGHFALKRMPQMRRVAIAPIIPSYDKRGKILLDSGANVDLRAEHLVDLGIYASVVAKEVLKRNNPKLGLVNIGSEPGKGRELDIETFDLLEANEDVNFIGNVEPKEVFTTEADILLTDGFTGNILMKSLEGAATGLGMILKDEIKSSLRSKIGALFMKKSLKNFKKSMDASEVGGALVIGLNHVLIKAHGNSNTFAFYNAIRQAKDMVEKDVIGIVNKVLEKRVEK
ncbi:MAG TPA: phosphate acyltransferase PlsX [Acholeplasmataceae bacterium]|nr:phosphate acyltransferase PlsX [Acholeplasmataceae bacterium]